MMLQTLLDTIDEKKKLLDEMRPIPREYLANIRAKFRLEYNYHSNHLEGNSLTMAETYSFLSTSLVSSEKVRKFSDYEEMKGHDDAVTHYNLLASLENTSEYIYDPDFHLSHKLIKEINAMLLVKDHKKIVKDQYGELYPVDVIVGQYKSKNNHVQRKDGTMFHFAPCEQVQYLMTDLIDRYTHNKNTIHPLLLASIFHYKFIRIHPFDDGNGRTARFVTNMILMHYGYPIVIVPSDEDVKQEYYNAIQLVDSYYPSIDLTECLQDPDTILFDGLNTYFAQRLIRSFDQVIAGASGEDIFTPGDIIKKFKLELASESNKKTFQLDRTWLDEGENFKHFWEKNICSVIDTVNIFIESVKNEYVNISYTIPPILPYSNRLGLSVDGNIFNKIEQEKFFSGLPFKGSEKLMSISTKDCVRIQSNYTLRSHKRKECNHYLCIDILLQDLYILVKYSFSDAKDHFLFKEIKICYGQDVTNNHHNEILEYCIGQYKKLTDMNG